MFTKIVHCLALSTLAISTPSVAWASDWNITANVNQVEVSYVPYGLLFKVDTTGGNCGVNSTLSWNVKGATSDQQNENVEAAFALLLTAKASGRSISLIGNNAGCTVDYMYLN